MKPALLVADQLFSLATAGPPAATAARLRASLPARFWAPGSGVRQWLQPGFLARIRQWLAIKREGHRAPRLRRLGSSSDQLQQLGNARDHVAGARLVLG